MKRRKSAFVLEAIHPCVHRDGRKGHYEKDGEGCFKCWKQTVGVFSSIDKAEETIRTLVKTQSDQNIKWKGWKVYVGFLLIEHYVDDALFGDGNNISNFESCRSYLSDGSLNCISDCDDRCEKKFVGTSCPNSHVMKESIALELCGDCLMPVLVESTSMTIDEWKRLFKEDTTGDWTDDSGLAFSANHGHVHPFAPLLFPMRCLPHAIIPQSEVKKMQKMRKMYFEGKAL